MCRIKYIKQHWEDTRDTFSVNDVCSVVSLFVRLFNFIVGLQLYYKIVQGVP